MEATTPRSKADVGSEPLSPAVRSGTRTLIASQIVSQLFSLAVAAMLFRWVDRQQFGLLGMVTPLLAFVRMLATLGLNVATVQRPRLEPAELSSLFWINLLLGGLATILAAVGSPLLAWLYDAPELTPIGLALSATLLMTALGSQHQALLERDLRIGRLSVIRLIALFCGGLAAVAAACAGCGVWALVLQQYVEIVVLAGIAWWVEPWRPNRPARNAAAGELLRFGGFYSLSSLMFFLATNADKLLLASLLGSTVEGRAVLGMYSQAFQLMMRPIYAVTTPIAGIMLPALSRARSSPRVYSELVVAFYRMVGISLIPCGLGLYLVAQDAMRVLGGVAWADAGRMLEALAPAIVVLGLMSIAGSLLASAGRTDCLFYGSVAFTILLCQGYAVGFWLGGMRWNPPLGPALGVAWSFSLVLGGVLFVPYLTFCFRVAGVNGRQVAAGLVRPFRAGICMVAVVLLVRSLLILTPLVLEARLLILVACGVAAYGVMARAELAWLRSQLTGTRPQRVQPVEFADP